MFLLLATGDLLPVGRGISTLLACVEEHFVAHRSALVGWALYVLEVFEYRMRIYQLSLF
jgi:hypothetical protein